MNTIITAPHAWRFNETLSPVSKKLNRYEMIVDLSKSSAYLVKRHKLAKIRKAKDPNILICADEWRKYEKTYY